MKMQRISRDGAIYSNWKITWFLPQASCFPCWSQRLKTETKFKQQLWQIQEQIWQNWGKSHFRGCVSRFDIIGRKDSRFPPDHSGPPIPFFPGHHDNISLLEAEVTLFAALVGVHGHVLWWGHTWTTWSEWDTTAFLPFTISAHSCVTFSGFWGLRRGWGGTFSIGWALAYSSLAGRDKADKKKTLSWKWNHLHCDDCSICVLDIDYYGHLALQHVYTHTDLVDQFGSPCIFAARCCTNWGCHSGRDELDITFGEPASLSGLQLT